MFHDASPLTDGFFPVKVKVKVEKARKNQNPDTATLRLYVSTLSFSRLWGFA